jgi:F-box/leucine-rich repeat protein 2/20
MAGCTLIEASTLQDLPASCVHLQDIDLSQLQCVTDAHITALFDYCHELHTLRMKGCLSVTDVSATAIARSTTIKKLKIGGCRNLSESGLNAISDGLPPLESVDLSDLEASVTDTCAKKLLERKGKKLTSLNLTNNAKLTNDILFSIGKHGRELRRLNLTGGARFHDSGLNCVVCDCVKMRKLFLSGCCALTDKSIAMLSTHGNDLEELDIVACSSTTLRARVMLAQSIPLVQLHYDKGELIGGAKTPKIPGYEPPPLPSDKPPPPKFKPMQI